MTEKSDALNLPPKIPKSPPPKKKRNSIVLTEDLLEAFAATSLSDRDRNIQNANETENALCGQLMLVSTVFLTISVVVLGNSESLSLLSKIGKVLLVLGLVTFVASIAAGIVYYLRNIRFYRQWANAHHNDYNVLRDRDYDSSADLVEKLDGHQKGLSSTSSPAWLVIQIILMGIGAATYVALVVSLLFDFGMK